MYIEILFCGMFTFESFSYFASARVQGALPINHFLLALSQSLSFFFSSHALTRCGITQWRHEVAKTCLITCFSVICPSVSLQMNQFWQYCGWRATELQGLIFFVSIWKGVYARGITLSEHLESIMLKILSLMTEMLTM